MNTIKTNIINELKVINNISEYSYNFINYTFDHIKENNNDSKKALIKIFKHVKKDDIIKETMLYCYNDYNKLFENTYLHSDDLFVFTDMIKNIVVSVSDKYDINKKYILVLTEILLKCLFYIMNDKTNNSFIFHSLLNSSIKSCEFDITYKYDKNKYKYFCFCC
jgi:hypothetical protein